MDSLNSVVEAASLGAGYNIPDSNPSNYNF
jgi:hypothetical protein